MTTRHLTPGMKRAHASAQAAIARAQAHVPPPTPEPTEEPWPPSPAAWRLRCRQIREDIDRDRQPTDPTAQTA